MAESDDVARNDPTGSAAENWAVEVRETVASEVRDLIRARRNDASVNILESSLGFADHNIKGITHAVNSSAAQCGRPGIACRSGCAACCYVRVSVMPAEALNLARHVKERFTRQELYLLLDRIRSYVGSIAALPVEGRMRHVLACPFLSEQQQCTVYQARPLACRMHHSLSREACEDPESPVPVIEDYVNATVPVMEGIYEGSGMAGTRPDELEFAPAMLVALEQEDVEERWLAGEHVFTGAVDLYLRDYVAKLLASDP
ncbi:MAG: YkgJ family cysteine cluster protein [Fimbriimonadales bacterium]